LNIACEKRWPRANPGASLRSQDEGEGAGHDGDLTQRGIGEHPLDIALSEGEQSGPDHGETGEDPQDGPRDVVDREQRVEAGDDIGAGGDHRRGVDESRRRRRALHGIGKPVVERDETRLSGDPGEEQDQGRRERRVAGHEGGRRGPRPAGPVRDDGANLGAARPDGEDNDAEDEADVRDARDQEGLVCGRASPTHGR
jgi:hypothetical protein